MGAHSVYWDGVMLACKIAKVILRHEKGNGRKWLPGDQSSGHGNIGFEELVIKEDYKNISW